MSNLEPHRARKRFGQNFLQNAAIIDAIVEAIHPTPTQHLLEIGPGQGALTAPLLSTGTQLTAVELDRDLVPRLQLQFGHFPHFKLRQGDALALDLNDLEPAQAQWRVVGNLPYNISTPLIFHLLGQVSRICDMHFMLQKEVVERLSAQPGDNHWGRLAIMVQYQCAVEPLLEVPPHAFHPAPKVDSAVVRLLPYPAPPVVTHYPTVFETIVREVFNMRRKTLRNSLKPWLDAARIEQLGIDPGLRPEVLSIAEFATLADAIGGDRA